jgi:hypothetical protein
MLISLSKKIAFFCVPKCGSTSVESVLKKHCEISLQGHPSIKHIHARRYERFIRPILREADPNHEVESFCIIRDPIDRLRSWYEYQARPALADPKHPRHIRYTGAMSYHDFLEAYLSNPQPEFARIGTQYDFIRLADGSCGVDRIFRLDQMSQVVEFLHKKLGGTIDIPQVNRSSPQESETIHPDLVERLLKAMSQDIQLYQSIGGHAESPFKAP